MSRIVFLLLGVMLSGCIADDADIPDGLRGGGKPVFKGGSMSSVAITASTIEVSAEIEKENGYKITERGFVWSTSSEPTYENGNRINSGTGIGVYSGKLEGLNGNEKYYIRPYAKNEKGIEYGSPELAIITNPGLGVVITNEVTAVHAASVIVGGIIENAGEGEIIERGIYYSPSRDFLPKESILSDSAVDVYNCRITDLSPSTLYYYKAFVRNTFGIFESAVDSVTTRDGLVSVGETNYKNEDYTEVLLYSLVENSDDTTVHILERGFCWVLATDVPHPDSLSIAYDTVHAPVGAGYFESVIRNLTSQKQYYARAYAKTLYGIAYSGTISFNTKADLPTVRTEDYEDLQKGMVTIACTVLDNGRSDIQSAGICWSLTNIKPTISDNRTPLTPGLGRRYSGKLSKLRGGTTYYLRAYATNANGTSYGEETKQFTTPPIISTGLAAFPGNELVQKSNVYFVIGNYLYIVGGDKGSNYTDLVWQYSISEDKWRQRKSLNMPLSLQAGVAYGVDGAYVFGGIDDAGNEKNSFYYYNQSTNLWDSVRTETETAPTPTHSAVSFTSNSSVYVVGGQSDGTPQRAIWEYNTIGKIWTRKADFPVAQYGGIAVKYNNDVTYIGMGKDAYGRCNGTIWPTRDGANTWQEQQYCPHVVRGVLGGVACGESIYIIDEYFNVIEFDTQEKRWPPSKRSIPVASFNCIFENNGKIYIGFDSSNSFIVYEPAWDN